MRTEKQVRRVRPERALATMDSTAPRLVVFVLQSLSIY